VDDLPSQMNRRFQTPDNWPLELALAKTAIQRGSDNPCPYRRQSWGYLRRAQL